MSANYRDLALEHLAADEVGLLAQLVELRADHDARRELAQRAIHALHDLTGERDLLRDQHHRLVDEYRALREQVLRRDAA